MDDSIMIAMSGGVDSAVAADLASVGRTAAGVTMNLVFQEGVQAQNDTDIADASALCQMIGIPHFVAMLGKDFYCHVVTPFVEAYRSGSTPNPCIFCNEKIKFGALLDFAHQNGYQKLATGHYARIEKNGSGRYLLRRAAHPDKDQSYMLYTLSQSVLSSVEFPLGALSKTDVRSIAAAKGFPMANKGDSQDICFIPDGDYAGFIHRFTGEIPISGNYIDTAGNILGTHRGQLNYTIGQRKGLGIALGVPAFVVAKSASKNTVTLGKNEDLFSTRVIVKNINLIPFDHLNAPLRVTAKARYRQQPASALVEQTDVDELTVIFDEPQRAVSPGQSLVIYDDDYVVGGGIIQNEKE